MPTSRPALQTKKSTPCGMLFLRTKLQSALAELGSAAFLRYAQNGGECRQAAPRSIAKKSTPCGMLFLRTKLQSALAELGSATGSLEAVFKSSEWRFPLIFQGFSECSTKIAPPFIYKNGGTLSTHGRGKCGIYNIQKVFGLIILHLRIDVHSCLAVFMPRKILNCLWINASIQKIGNVGMP